MEEYSRELLRSGIIEAKSGHHESARRYLDRAIYMTGSHDVLAEAWFWMGEVTTDPAAKRKALENCLSHDLRHARARRALAILDGKLKADEVVNPDKLPAVPEGLRTSDAQRFMCPKCGGRMAFAPDGQTLTCDYCSRSRGLAQETQADEKDFIIAMATSRGHGRPLQEQVFHCNGCGAEFILPPGLISASCLYCDSPHVVNLENTKDLLAPDGIIPHAFSRQKAVQILVNWVESNQVKPQKKVEMPRGLYLPMWTFDIGGAIDYTAEVIEYEDQVFARRGEKKVVLINDQYPILVDDLPLPASRKLSAVFLKLIPTFDRKAIQPYDPRFLASWPAEIYDVPMADASLDARSQAYARYRDRLPSITGRPNIVRTSSANLAVESFKLNLLPVWMTEMEFGGRTHLVLINGQSGDAASDIPDPAADETNTNWLDFLSGLLDD